MEMIDKRGLLARPQDVRNAVVELGCGPRKRHAESIGVDVIDSEAVDIVGDALEVLRALPAGRGVVLILIRLPPGRPFGADAE